MLPQHPESINIPTDRDAYRAWLASLPEPTPALLFGVVLGGDTFRCPTNGRLYVALAPELKGECIWTKCYWCDTSGRVRGEKGFDPDFRQPHAYPIVEEVVT